MILDPPSHGSEKKNKKSWPLTGPVCVKKKRPITGDEIML